MNSIDFKVIEEVGSNILESVNPLLVLRCAKNAVREKNWVIPMRWDRGKLILNVCSKYANSKRY